MTTNKKLLICTLLILTMFSIVGVASASDLTHANSTISDTHSETISHDDSQSSATESHATQLKSSSDNKEKQTATNDEITSSSQIDEKEITTQNSEEKTISSDIKGQSKKDKKLYKSSQNENKLGTEKEVNPENLKSIVESAEDGDIINLQEGTYEISNSITIKSSITINGNDNTILKRIDGANIFSYTESTEKTIILNNIVFTATNDVKNPLINLGAGNIQINNCKFTDTKSAQYGSLIKTYADANVTIDSCEFYNLLGGSNGAGTYIYPYSEITNIINCSFHDITVNDGTFLRAIIYINAGSGTTNVSECKFYNITSDKMFGIIEAGTSGTPNLIVSKTSFNDNKLSGTNLKGVICFSKANSINVTYCAFDLTNDQKAIVKYGSNDPTRTAENNWYNNNKPDDSIVSGITPSKWIVYEDGEYKITDGTSSEKLTVIIPGLNDPKTEPQIPIIYVSETGLDTADGLSLENATTLNHAINIADNGGTIKISAGTYTGNGYEITKNLTILGIGTVKIDANNLGQIFNIQNSNVTIDNLILVNGKADKGGAIYLSNSNITITNTTFKTNNAEHFGGAIYVDSNSDAKITKSVFINNAAKGEDYFSYGMYTGGGDAVYNDGKTTINYSILITDYTAGDGGRVLIHNNNIDNEVNAQNNWWGNINIPSYIDTMNYDEYEETSIDTSNEIILTLTPTDESIYTDGTTTIKAEFKIEDDDLTEKLPTIKINTTTNIGTVPQEITIENNQATFTYTAPTEKGTATIKASYDKLNPITTTTIEVKEQGAVYNGIIYVSKTDASDDNEGSETKPVASIAKAIELAQAGSGKIIINEGTYEENGLTISQNINITTNGNVIINAKNLNNIFNVTNNAKLVLNNLKLINGKADKGGAIFVKSGSSLEIVNVTFENNNATNGGAIYINTNTNVKVTESAFIKNNATNGGAIYVTITNQYEAPANVNITKTKFINNTAKDGSNSNAIYTGGKTNINYCILINHNNNGLIYGIDTDNILNARYNWWGTNTPDFNKLVEEYYYYVDEWETYEAEIDTSHWIVMNVTPASADLHGGESQDITVDFTKDNTGATLSDHIPELDVTASVTNGELNTTKATTKNNIAKFKYTAPSTGDKDTIPFKSGNQITTVPITINNEIPEPTTGIVYVSTAANANDYNEGTEEKPVASIAKAIEIATSATGSKKIIILDGTYIANGIVIDSDLNITGKGNVIWDANGEQSFNMTTNHILTISNIKFTNGNSSSHGHLFRVDNGEISIDNCKFLSNGGNVGGTNGIIYINKAKLTVTNSIFENNTAGRGTSYGIISVKDSELYVDNCNFTNNYNKNGMIYIQASNIGSTATIKNSKFIGNNATSASGGSGAGIYIVGDYTNKVSTNVLVDNCDFINNTAKGGTYYAGDGGAIHVANNATLIVSKSNFINNYVENNTDNTLLGKGGAIYAHAANVKITESLFKNNFATLGSEIYMENLTSITDDNLHRLNVTKSTFNSTSTSKLIESNYNNGRLFAIGNTWINTEDPSTRVSEGIIVKDGKLDPTITINVNNPTEGEKAIITVNTGDATGNVTITIEGKTPETVNIINGIATLSTTELTAGAYNITVTYNGDNKYNTKTENTTITIKSKTTPPGPTPTNVVSPNNIDEFFDENGVLKENAPDELIFSGDFHNLSLTINKPVNITGDNAVFNNSALNITADNVKVSNIEFVADENFDKTALISTTGKNTTIENNTMTITGNPEATGIFAENATIAVNNNNITTTNNNTMILNNTNGTLNNNKLKGGNNINGSASISHTGSNITFDNKPLNESEPEPGKKDPEKQTPTETPKQDTPTTTPTTPTTGTQTQKESDDNIPAKQIKITTPKTPKTISKRAKKLTIRVKLKVKGKLAKGKKVVIIIKGKKYTRKTNKKGIAKLTLKKAKLRKILRKVKVGKKITYKVKFGKKTIKRSLKVKK